MDFLINPESDGSFAIVLIILVLWTLPWKALALWKSARHGQKWWFIIFMIVNTVGLLEIFYLLVLPKLRRKNQ